MADTAELIAIGMIEKPFGVKGEVRVRSLSDVPGRLEGLKDVTLVAASGRALVTAVTVVTTVAVVAVGVWPELLAHFPPLSTLVER